MAIEKQSLSIGEWIKGNRFEIWRSVELQVYEGAYKMGYIV